MSHKFALKNTETGGVFEHPQLLGRKYFTTIDAVKNFVSSGNPILEGKTFLVIDSLGQELLHFFSDVPVYAVRHRQGMLYDRGVPHGVGWHKRKSVAIGWFKKDERRVTPGFEELNRLQNWYVCDQYLREVKQWRDHFFVVPEEPGQWAILYKHGVHRSLLKRTNGKCWFATIKGLKRYAASCNAMVSKEKHGWKTFIERKRGYVIIRSTGSGQYEELPEVDPFF